MARIKKVGILLVVLAVVCAAALGVSRYEEKKEQIKNSEEIILETDPETVNRLVWENEKGTFSFHRKEKWQYDDDAAFPVDGDKIKDMLGVFASFGVSFVIDDVEDYAQYGLDKPVCKIGFTAGDTDYEVSIGAFSAMDEQRYVSLGDGKVYLVKNDPMDQYDAGLSDVIDHDEPLAYDKVTNISISGMENENIIRQEDSRDSYCKDDVYFLQSETGNLPLDTSLVDGYLKGIRQLELKDYVTYNATEKELTDYGLDSPEFTMTVDYTYKEQAEGDDGDKEEKTGTYVLKLGRSAADKRKVSAEELLKEDDEKSGEKGKDEKDEKEKAEEVMAYVRIGDSQIIYGVTKKDYLKIMKASYNDFRHKKVFTGSLGDVSRIDIVMEDRDYVFTSRLEDEETVWSYGDKKISFKDFRNAINGLKADSFTDEKPLEKREISLIFHLDNEDFPQVQVALYRYDGAHCLAVVDGKSISLIVRSAAVKLMESVNAIVLDREEP